MSSIKMASATFTSDYCALSCQYYAVLGGVTLLGMLDLECEDTTTLRNVGKYLPIDKA
jgi:hypothetical protein